MTASETAENPAKNAQSGPSSTTLDLVPILAAELNLPGASVAAVLKLAAEGGTVPFIARYRKEATGGLDEIGKQGKLTPELAARIQTVATKAELEDLYLPYKPKRRTRAVIATERGLEPLARRILAQPSGSDPNTEAASF